MSKLKRYFEADNLNNLYINIVNEVVNNPEYKTSPRGMAIKEITNVNAILTNPLKNIVTLSARKMNHAFSIIEKFEYLSGQTSQKRLEFYNKNYKPFRNKYKMYDGAYPDRLHYWTRHIHNLLKTDPNTRQAIATIYGPQDRHSSLDIPCTIFHHYIIRKDKLNLTVYMRSNDLLWGFPYDVSAFCFLQKAMAAMLGIEVGTYTHIAGSMHSYNSKEEELTSILRDTSAVHLSEEKIEKCSFDEMMQNINLFWYIEKCYRTQFDFADQMTLLLSKLPITFLPYIKEICEYIKKEYNKKK